MQKSDKALSLIIKKASRIAESQDTLSSAPAAQPEVDDGDSDLGESGVETSKPLTVEALRLELSENFESSLLRNMEVFQGKFDIQKREISDEISKAMIREGDVIVRAIEEGFGRGPHEKIRDPDMRQLWENMVSLPSASAIFAHRLAPLLPLGMDEQRQSETFRPRFTRLLLREGRSVQISDCEEGLGPFELLRRLGHTLSRHQLSADTL